MVKFKAEIQNISEFKALFLSLGEFLDECVLTIKNDGITSRSADSDHKAVMTFILPHTYFKQFKCNINTKIGINLHKLNKILQTINNNDRIQISLDNDVFNIIVPNKHCTYGTLIHYYPVLSEKTYNIYYKSQIPISASKLNEILNTIVTSGDLLTITVRRQECIFSVNNNKPVDIDGNNTITQSNVNDYKFPLLSTEYQKEEQSCTIPLKYIKPLIKNHDLFSGLTCNLRIENNKPLLITMTFGDRAIPIKLSMLINDKNDDITHYYF